MKIGGVNVTPCEELLVLPRPDGQDIPIRAKAVSINDEFDAKVPMPVPPTIQKKGKTEKDLSDKGYVEAVKRRESQRFALMCIRSLEPSEIEWERVDLDKPGTWLEWEKELTDSGLSEVECNRIIGAVMAANALDENKIKAARDAFLLGQGQ